MSFQESQRESSIDAPGVIVANDVGTTEEELLRAIDATIKPFSEGDLVEGTIVKIDREEVLVDIGYKSEGVIPTNELSIRNDIDPSQIVSLGEKIEALVLQKEDAEGRLILSKKRASYEKAWDRVEALRRSEGVVKGQVIEVVKGGLIVDIGLRGFLPASLVDLRRVRDLQQFVGQEIDCKIIELDRNRNNVVLSRRAFLEESQSEHRKEFLENLKPGETRKGTISSIVNFGAFVDLGGVDGLVHVSELSWKHVEHPGEIVKVGEEVEVEVLSVDLERDRVSLSLKSTQEDPWRAFARAHRPGDVVQGVISRIVPFGAFVQLNDAIEGLIHISELSDEHVELPDQIVTMGEEVSVRVLDIDLERRRISLSVKQAMAPPVATYTTVTPDIEKEPEKELEPEIAREEPAAEAEVGVPPAEPEVEVPAAEPEVEVPAAETPAEEPLPAAEAAETPAESAPGVVEREAEPPPAAKEPEAELEGELLDREEETGEESLEAIVEDMKREREQ